MTTTDYAETAITKRAKRIQGVIDLATANDAVGEGIDLIDMQSVSVQLGAFTGTIVFEVQNRDDGAWVSKALTPVAGGAPVTSTTAAGMWSGDIGGRRFRARRSAGSSTTANVDILAMPESQANVQTSQAVTLATGTSGPAKAEDAVHASGDQGIYVLAVRSDAPSVDASAAGDYASTKVDRHGAQIMRSLDSMKRTYAAAVKLTTIPTGTPVLEIVGAASTTVEINRITATLNGTAAGKVDLTLSKRSTAGAGGTFTNPAKVPYDAADSAALATVKAHTVAATTPGTLIGVLRQAMLAVTAANVPSDRLRLESGQYSKSLTLTAATQAITLEIVGTLPTGAELSLDIEWTEF